MFRESRLSLFAWKTIDTRRNAKTDRQMQLLRFQIQEQQYLLQVCRMPTVSLLHHKYDDLHRVMFSVPCIFFSGRSGWIARLYTDQLAEGLTEFGVEHSVYYGIHKAVHVAQPGSDDEGCDTRLTSLRQLRADCIHDVASEEWHPAY